MFRKLPQILHAIARADTVFYLLPVLMALLLAGTIAQKYMGLYAAQSKFFGSFIFFAGPLPLPGGFTVLSLLALSLLIKFLLHSEWTWRKSGINITHCGVLVLLFGGLLTALTARESFMVIPEGSASEYIYDYHPRNLYIFENDALMKTIPFPDLQKPVTGVPFELKIIETCANCAITRQEEKGNFHDMARFMQLKSQPSGRDPETDISGLTFSIKGLKKQDGTYIAFEGMPKPITLQAPNKKEYKIIFGKQQSLLPFSLRLMNFEKDSYPGTDKARAYHSDVIVEDGKIEWPARIEMNKPLRYKGYTFYQSSFEQNDDMQATILSVVENKGRLFPYLGTVIIAAGLLLHIIIILRGRKA